jgi:hypothetical protein
MTALARILEVYDADSPSWIRNYFDDPFLDLQPREYFTVEPELKTFDDDSASISIEPFLGWREALDTVRSSRAILSLTDNWDSEGASGYLEATWTRATNYLLEVAKTARDVFGRRFPVPLVSPAQEGSIDLFWKLPQRTLLINVPAASDERITFYGSSQDGNTIGGEIGAGPARSDLVEWLCPGQS